MGSPLASPTPTSLCYTLHIFVCILYRITIPYYTTHYKYTVCRCGTGIYLQKSIKGNTIQPSQRHSNKVANGIVAAQRFARHMCIVCTPYSEHNMMGGGKIICPRYREEKKNKQHRRRAIEKDKCQRWVYRYNMLWAMCCGYGTVVLRTHFAANLYTKNDAQPNQPFSTI